MVEWILEKRLHGIVAANEMEFCFIPERGIINAVSILRRLQEGHYAKETKLYMCFVNIDRAIDRVPRKVLKWAMRMKGMLEVLVRSVMSLYDGAR